MSLSIILAVADNGVIGRGNTLPWKLSQDLKRFRSLTMNHHVIMGRRTFESLPSNLPGRTLIVLSRDPGWQPPQGVARASSLAGALKLTQGDPQPFVIGGRAVFLEAWPLAQRLYLTRVHAEPAGDVTLPPLDLKLFDLVQSSGQAADERNEFPVTFEDYQRRA